MYPTSCARDKYAIDNYNKRYNFQNIEQYYYGFITVDIGAKDKEN